MIILGLIIISILLFKSELLESDEETQEGCDPEELSYMDLYNSTSSDELINRCFGEWELMKIGFLRLMIKRTSVVDINDNQEFFDL